MPISIRARAPLFPSTARTAPLGNAIWQALLPGSMCANDNDGDIIVKFDRDAQRWIMTQNVFSSPYAVCVAISQTSTFSDNTVVRL